jgi:hypothetical protein
MGPIAAKKKQQLQARPDQLAAQGSVDSQLDRQPARQLDRQLDDELPDQLPDQLPRLKRTIDDPAQAGHPAKRQARDRSATVLPFTPPPTSPAPTYETEARDDMALPATPSAQTIGNGKGGWVDLTGSPTLIDLTTSPTPARSPLRPLSSSAFNKGRSELQALLDENPWT